MRAKSLRARLTRGNRCVGIAARVLVFATLGMILYVAREAIVPVALALLLTLVLSGPVESLHARRVPRTVSAVVILAIALLFVGLAVSVLWTPAQHWFNHAPQTMAAIKEKLGPLSKDVSRIERLWSDASGMGAAAHNRPAAAPSGESAPLLVLNVGGSIMASSLTFVMVTLFLLTGGPPMLARMAAAFASNLQASHVVQIIEKVRLEVGHFYLTTTLINIALGIITALCMWAWGMPSPYLWGAFAALANYIPYAGSISTLLVITLVAAVSFDTLGQVFGISATYIVLATLEGQVAQPLLVGRRMEVNPLVIFLGLWFGGLFWGVPGIILATPTLVALKVIAEHSASGKRMLEFLGPNAGGPTDGPAAEAPEPDPRLGRLSHWLSLERPL